MHKILVIVLTAVVWAANSSIVSQQLEVSLERNGATNIFISFKAGTSGVLASIDAARFNDRAARLNALHDALRNHAQES